MTLSDSELKRLAVVFREAARSPFIYYGHNPPPMSHELFTQVGVQAGIAAVAKEIEKMHPDKVTPTPPATDEAELLNEAAELMAAHDGAGLISTRKQIDNFVGLRMKWLRVVQRSREHAAARQSDEVKRLRALNGKLEEQDNATRLRNSTLLEQVAGLTAERTEALARASKAENALDEVAFDTASHQSGGMQGQINALTERVFALESSDAMHHRRY